MSTVRVTHDPKQQSNLRHEVYVGRHHLIADEPAELGGEDLGPTPYDYLSSALAACTAITLRMYAQRKGFPLENTDVTVEQVREKEVTRFKRKIELVGPLSDEQKKRLMEIANRCPVHVVLSGKIEIETAN